VCVVLGNFDRQPGVSAALLASLEPRHEESLKQGKDEVALMHILCRLLHVHKENWLPTESHDMPKTVEALGAALSQHYTQTKEVPLNEEYVATLKQGWYTVEGKAVRCTADVKEKKTELLFDSSDSISPMAPLDLDSEFMIKVDGRKSPVGSVAQEFRDAGVKLPKGVPDWKGDLFGTPRDAAQNQTKRKTTGDKPDESQATPSSAFASKESTMLSQALRKKLQMVPGHALVSSPQPQKTSNNASSSGGSKSPGA
jgi:hypothetical protein